jgi:hypothetical protein
MNSVIYCPTCFEPLIWVHLQGLLISNHTLFTPTGTTVYTREADTSEKYHYRPYTKCEFLGFRSGAVWGLLSSGTLHSVTWWLAPDVSRECSGLIFKGRPSNLRTVRYLKMSGTNNTVTRRHISKRRYHRANSEDCHTSACSLLGRDRGAGGQGSGKLNSLWTLNAWPSSANFIIKHYWVVCEVRHREESWFYYCSHVSAVKSIG